MNYMLKSLSTTKMLQTATASELTKSFSQAKPFPELAINPLTSDVDFATLKRCAMENEYLTLIAALVRTGLPMRRELIIADRAAMKLPMTRKLALKDATNMCLIQRCYLDSASLAGTTKATIQFSEPEPELSLNRDPYMLSPLNSGPTWAQLTSVEKSLAILDNAKIIKQPHRITWSESL